MRRELSGAVTLAALALCALLALAYLTPDEPYGVVASNLRPYAGAVLVVLAILLLIVRAWWRAGTVVLLGIAAAGHVGVQLLDHYTRWEQARALAGPGGTKLRLVSFNMLSSNLSSGPAIAKAFLDSGADVIFAMESDPLKPQLAAVSEQYPYRLGCGEGTTACDLMILSRLPLLDPQIANLGELSFDRFMSAHIVIGGKGVALAAVHLVKPYFDGYGWLEVRRLTKRLDAMEGPLVLAGDFNAATWSRTIDLVTARTNLLIEPLPVGTWPAGFSGLGLPIDHVFARPPLVIDNVDPMPGDLGSNHRGLVVDLRLPD